MNPLNLVQNFIDGCIGVFSPKKYIQQKTLRQIQHRKYDAAFDYAGSRPWTNVGSTTPNEEITASWQAVTNRIRMQERDFPLMKQAVRTHISYTVHTGVKLEMRLKKPDGELDKKLNDQIEHDFNKVFAKQVDVSGRLHYWDMERLAERQMCQAGGCIFVKVYPKNKNLLVPFQLQAYELDWLDSSQDRIPSTKNDLGIENGIKYNASTGEIISFFLRKPYEFYHYETVEIPAKSVIFYNLPDRFGQLLPISSFTSGLQTANTFNGYLESENDRAYAAAQTAAIIEKDADVGGLPGISDASEDEKLELNGLAVAYLGPGERANYNTTPNIGGAFESFLAANHRLLAQATNTPIEKLTKDFTKLNYSVARNSLNDYLYSKEEDFDLHCRFFSDPVVEEFFKMGALSGMRLPGYFKNPMRYMDAVSWRRPAPPALDPTKDSKAASVNLENGLDSPQNIMRSKGLDPDKILAEIAEAKKKLDSLGIDIDWGNTSNAVATSPSKLEGQK